MKRCLPRVCVFLVLGAIVNVAVAWGCAIWSPLTMALFAPLDVPQPWNWPADVPHDWPLAPNSMGHDRSFGVSEMLAEWSDLTGELPPRPALWKASSSAHGWNDGLDIPEWLPRTERGHAGVSGLPLLPIWPGFAINTVFYAGVLWLLFAAPFALRRRRRIKRGLCPKCAYDLRGSASQSCPECGATR